MARLVAGCGNGGVAVVALENLWMRFGARGDGIRPAQVTIAALMDQGVQTGLTHIPVHEERFMCGMALDTRRVRIRDPKKQEMFPPINLRKRPRPGIQFAMADQTILAVSWDRHFDVIVLGMPCTGPMTGLTLYPAVGILFVNRNNIAMTLGASGTPGIGHGVIPCIIKGRAAVESETAERFWNQQLADTQRHDDQDNQNSKYGIDVPVVRTNRRLN